LQAPKAGDESFVGQLFLKNGVQKYVQGKHIVYQICIIAEENHLPR
jgi:hypothetical protein